MGFWAPILTSDGPKMGTRMAQKLMTGTTDYGQKETADNRQRTMRAPAARDLRGPAHADERRQTTDNGLCAHQHIPY